MSQFRTRLVATLLSFLTCAAGRGNSPVTIQEIIGQQKAGLAELFDHKAFEFEFQGLRMTSPGYYHAKGPVYLTPDARRLTGKSEQMEVNSTQLVWREESYLYTKESLVSKVQGNNTVEEFPLIDGKDTSEVTAYKKRLKARTPLFIENWLAGTSSVTLETLAEGPDAECSVKVESAEKAQVSVSPGGTLWFVLTLNPSLHWWVTDVTMVRDGSRTVVEYEAGLPKRLAYYRPDGVLRNDAVIYKWGGSRDEDVAVLSMVDEGQYLFRNPVSDTDQKITYRKMGFDLIVDAAVTAASNPRQVAFESPSTTQRAEVKPPPPPTSAPASKTSYWAVPILAAVAMGVAISLVVILKKRR